MILNSLVSCEHKKPLWERRVFFLLTKEEQELIEAIREAKDPTAAILAATEIIKDFLAQPLSLKEQEALILRESA